MSFRRSSTAPEPACFQARGAATTSTPNPDPRVQHHDPNSPASRCDGTGHHSGTLDSVERTPVDAIEVPGIDRTQWLSNG